MERSLVGSRPRLYSFAQKLDKPANTLTTPCCPALCARSSLCKNQAERHCLSVICYAPQRRLYWNLLALFFAKKKGAHHFTEITRKHRNNRVKTARNVTWTHSSRTHISRPALRQWRVCMGGCNSVIDNHVVNLIDQSQFISIYIQLYVPLNRSETCKNHQKISEDVAHYDTLHPFNRLDRPAQKRAVILLTLTDHARWPPV